MNSVKRLTPQRGVLRALFSRSGNECSFPECSNQLINHKNQFIGQVCHIEGALPKGERFNSKQTNEDRRGYDNLILFCYEHHIETNDVECFSVDFLKSIKLNHEKSKSSDTYNITEYLLKEIEGEIYRYWQQFDVLKINHHMDIQLALNIDSSSNPLDVAEDIYNKIEWGEIMFSILYDTNGRHHTFMNSLLAEKNNRESGHEFFEEENWELHNIGIPNFIRSLKGNVMHLELKYLEEYLKNTPDDVIAKERLNILQDLLINYVTSTYLMD